MVHKPIKLFAGVLWNVEDLKLALVTLAAVVDAAHSKLTLFSFAPPINFPLIARFKSFFTLNNFPSIEINFLGHPECEAAAVATKIGKTTKSSHTFRNGNGR